MKPIMIFRESFGKKYQIYKLNDDGSYFCSIADPNMGFSMQKVIDNIRVFCFFDSFADANMFIRESELGMVEAVDADIFCPHCNRGYLAEDHSHDECVWNYVKECACGHKMKVEGRQVISYTVLPL